MKLCLLFQLFVAVCVQAQDAAKPAVQQSDPETKDYYGAYAPGGESMFNHNPNSFLVECVRNQNRAKRWMLAWAQAEMSLYLASHGWEVTGFDIADVGVAQARTKG